MQLPYISLITAILFSLCCTAQAETLEEYRKGPVSVVVTQSLKNTTIVISVTGNPQITRMDLQDPTRIVLDFSPVQISGSKTIALEKSGMVKSIRLGSHPEKARFVLDLESTEIPPYSFLEKNGGSVLEATIIVPLPQESNTRSEAAPTPAQTVTPQATPVASAVITPQVTATPPKPLISTPVPTATATATPKVTPTPVATPLPPSPSPSITPQPTQRTTIAPTPSPTPTATPKPTPSSTPRSTPTPTLIVPSTPVPTPSSTPAQLIQEKQGGVVNEPHVSKLHFVPLMPEKTPALEIKVTTPPIYKLVKKSEKEYLLSIQNCAITSGPLTLPIFAPRDFTGFKYAVASSKDNGTDVSIGVEKQVKLAAFTKDGSIWIKAQVVSDE
jgi:hypothetical protein